MADSLEGKWRERALLLLAGCLENVERIDEAIKAWGELAETAEDEWSEENARQRARSLEARRRLGPGNPAPDFSAMTTKGEKITLSQFRGSVVVLVFEHVWGLQRGGSGLVHYVLGKVGDRGAVVVDVVWSPSRDRVVRASRRKSTAYEVVPDGPAGGGKGIFELYGVDDRALYLYVIGADGTIAARGHASRLEETLRVAESLLDGSAGAE